MKSSIFVINITAGLLSFVNIQAADDISSMFSNGKASGQIREFSINRKYQGSAGTTTHRSANAVGGKLKYETDELKGVSLGASFYTTNGFGLGADKANNSKVDPTLLGKDNNSYSILGEAYFQYKIENTTFKGGRQKLDTPLAGSDDARMLPNLFEAYVLSNTDIPYTTLIAAHVTKFAQGTFGRAYSGGILAATGGYSATDDKNQVGDFVNMGDYAIGTPTKGVTAGAVIYKPNNYFKAQVWNAYVHDVLNAIYADADIKWNCLLIDSFHPFLSAQMIKENNIGDKRLSAIGGDGKIDSLYWSAKLGFKVAWLTLYGAYSQTSANSTTDVSYANAIISPFGGMPAFTQGMVTRHQFLAGTKASKVAASYSFNNLGPNISATAYYASFDMDENSGYGIKRTATEPGFDVIYNDAIVKNLQLRVRGNFPRKFAESASGDTGWNEYRFIANYNF
ncbi:OprD family outer membrane porin [Sulfurimonas sp.]|uniref:OprD family outer membrane porin n=1 Tax=Sulfurimonas sp. TaxID=2022749 RepID=UPI00356614FD